MVYAVARSPQDLLRGLVGRYHVGESHALGHCRFDVAGFDCADVHVDFGKAVAKCLEVVIHRRLRRAVDGVALSTTLAGD